MSTIIKIILLTSVIASCQIFSNHSFEIVSWQPGSGIRDNTDNVIISITFSLNPDKTSVESAFKFEKDSLVIPGIISWQDRNMIFQPFEKIQKGHDYEILISTMAEAENGLSLEKDFIGRFSTKHESIRPEIISVDPIDRSFIDAEYENITILASEPIDTDSFIYAAQLIPEQEGYWNFSEDKTTAFFVPLAPWRKCEHYELVIRTGLKDLNGNYLSEEFHTVFETSTDRISPYTISVCSVVPEGDNIFELSKSLPLENVNIISQGWETDWGFSLSFSEDVSRESIVERISTEPALLLECKSLENFGSQFVFVPNEPARYNQTYSLYLSPGIEDRSGNVINSGEKYLFMTNGPKTMPPKVIEIRFKKNPDIETESWQIFSLENAFNAIDVSLYSAAGIEYATLVDVVIALGEGQVPDLISFMEAFSITTTNSCAGISIRSVEIKNPETIEPSVINGAFVIRVGILFSNKVNPGIITFLLGKTFKDKRGTFIENEFRLPLIK